MYSIPPKGIGIKLLNRKLQGLCQCNYSIRPDVDALPSKLKFEVILNTTRNLLQSTYHHFSRCNSNIKRGLPVRCSWNISYEFGAETT